MLVRSRFCVKVVSPALSELEYSIPSQWHWTVTGNCGRIRLFPLTGSDTLSQAVLLSLFVDLFVAIIQ